MYLIQNSGKKIIKFTTKSKKGKRRVYLQKVQQESYGSVDNGDTRWRNPYALTEK